MATRHLTEQLSKALGRNFFVENRPGAGPSLGMEALARSAPDGYTLGIGTAGTQTMNPSLFPSLGLRPGKGFRADHAHRYAAFDGCVTPVVRGWLDPGADRGGEGEAGHAERRASRSAAAHRFRVVAPAGRRALFAIAYKGSAAALPEVMSGQVPDHRQHHGASADIDSGRLKPLGVTSLGPPISCRASSRSPSRACRASS